MDLAVTNSQLGLGLAILVLVALAALAIGILVQMCIIWIVSKLVIPSTGTFRNAARYFGWQFLVSLGMLVVLGLLVVAVAFSAKNATTIGVQAWIHLFVVFAMIWFAISLWVPMHVYEVSIWRALAFKIVLMAIGFCFTLANIQLQEKYNPAYAEMRRAQEKQFKAQFDQISRLMAAPADNQSRDTVTPTPSPLPATPKPALTPARPSSELALTQRVDFPVVVNGADMGSVTLPPGTRVKLISVEGGQLRVRYNNSEATIPVTSTDYDPTRNAP
ncbi:MAG TPA: hypothetical protein VG733_06700 [Chthoniobacteraceae bacterium]|nr:hypothetical protein [Chthoniobacteraceae bacterium]